MILRGLAALLFMFALSACTLAPERINWVGQDGSHFETVKVHPDWYSAETITTQNGKVVATQHTDLAMAYGAAAIMAAILGAIIPVAF